MSFFQSLLAGSDKIITLAVGDSNTNGDATGITTANAGALKNFNGTTWDDITTQAVTNSNPGKGSIFHQMANDILANTGQTTWLVNTALGGADISPAGDNNDWSTTGLRYAAMQTKVADAIANGGGRVGRIIVGCGVNDVRAATAIATITTHWNSLLDRLHADFPDAEILIVNVGRIEAASFNQLLVQVRDLQVTTTWARSYCHMVNSGAFHVSISGGYEADNLHYSLITCNAIGTSIAKWVKYSSYTKWARSIIAAHFDDIDATARTKVQDLVDDMGADLESVALFTPLKSSDVKNYLIDFTFRSFNGAPSGGFLQSANGWMNSNGATANSFPAGFYTGFSSAGGITSTNYNFFVRVGAIRTASGTACALFGTVTGGAGSSRVQLFDQAGATQVTYAASDATLTLAADTSFVPDVLHSAGRLSGDKFYHQGSTQISTSAVALVAAVNSALWVGARNNNGTLDFPIDADYGFVGAFPSAADRANLVAAVEAYLA